MSFSSAFADKIGLDFRITLLNKLELDTLNCCGDIIKLKINQDGSLKCQPSPLAPCGLGGGDG